MAETQEAQILRRLLDATWQPLFPDAWAHFDTRAGRHVVGAVFFLLDVAADRDVEAFLLHDGDRLLQHLHRRTDRLQVEQRGQVRGHVLWPSTYKARYAGDFDPTRFVCREVRSEYDTPENQAIKYVLNCIGQSLDLVPAALQAGICYLGPANNASPSSPGRSRAIQGALRRTLERLDNLDVAIHRCQRNIYLRGVTLPDHLSDEHLRRVEAAKLPEYRAVMHLYRAHRRLCHAPTLNALRSAVTAVARRVLPLPGGASEYAAPWLSLAADLLRDQIATSR